MGDEFTLTLTLVSDRPMSSRVELSYDPSIIAQSASGDPGRATLDVRAAGLPGVPQQPQQLRFKVLAKQPVATSISIQASSSDGTISAPDSHAISIVARKP